MKLRPGILVAIFCLAALALRTIPRFDAVFQGDFVNFQETDAWFHVRMADNLVHHFPHRITLDPYLTYGSTASVATGPFYDSLLAAIAWIAGFGHPSEALVHLIAAWYPAILGTLIVPVVFLLGRMIFGLAAALVASAIVATLPGHFLTVSSLGFTDHHVMESLLSALLILTVLRAFERPGSLPRAILAGFVLGAYLLTFVGGAFFIAIIVAWAAYDRIRSLWPRDDPPFAPRPFYIAFLLAAILIAPSYRTLWMTYSIATLLLGVVLVFTLDQWLAYCRNRRVLFFTGLMLTATAVASAAFFLIPGLRGALHSVIPFFFPSYFGTSGAVGELQALILSRGSLTLVPAWRQFAGAFVLSIVALFLLAELSLKRATRGPTLVFFWGLATFLLSMGQVRMTYYFAIAAALLSGYLIARIFEADPRPAVRWTLAAAVVVTIFVPNVAAAFESPATGVPEDWRQALDWINHSTPEPFGDPSFYYADYTAQQASHPAAYSIMAWWDYGYWIQAIARRVPVSNPTQANASVAASFFLSQSENEAIGILNQWHSRYVIVNADLPLLLASNGVTRGDFPDFFLWDKSKNIDQYILASIEPGTDGKLTPHLLYLPAYYRSLAARLFVYGSSAVPDPKGAVVAYFDRKQTASGKSYRTLTDLRRFDSALEAQAVERSCRDEGCVLAGENPQISCIPLDPLTRFHPVFGAGTSVKVYELVNP